MKYKKGITVIICSLNSEKDLSGLIESVLKQTLKPNQIIITDGGSSDNTKEIAKKYKYLFIESKPGFYVQLTNAIPKILYDTVLRVEMDHRYPTDFLENFYKKHISLNSFATQASLVCVKKDNYFEKAFSYIYDKNNQNFGQVDLVAGPLIMGTKNFIFFFSELSKINSSEKIVFSIDTLMSEIIKKFNLKCYKVDVFAYQYQELNFKIIAEKYFKYGEGDHFFYKNFAKQWTFYRKLKSLTHVLRKHFLLISLHSIKDLKIHYIPFFMISSFFRYLGFLNKILR